MGSFACVVCHGSYHTPELYQPLVDLLNAKGVEAYCPQLPTADLAQLNVGDVKTPDFDLGPPPEGYPQGDKDLEVVLAAVKPSIDSGKKVLLLGHSSGGWVASQAARPELLVETRKANGQEGGIFGILYVGAFIIPLGQSIYTFFQPEDGSFVNPPFVKFHKHGAKGLGTFVEAEKYLFNDLGPEVAAKWTSLLTASPVLTTTLTNEPYSKAPCAYLILEKDCTLPKEYQEGMIAMQTQKGGNFEVYRCPSGHSPQLSWTEGLVDTVLDFAGKNGA